MKNLYKLYGLLLLLSLVFVGCSNQENNTTNGNNKPDTTNQEQTENDNRTKQKLTIYSNSLSDGRSQWLETEAKNAGFDLDFVDAGGGKILNRLIAEKNSPMADVTFGMDESMFYQLVDENILVKYNPSWAEELPADSIVGDEYFYPITEQRIFMTYNPEFIEESELPTKWEDLGNVEKYKGNYIIPGNLTGGTNQKAVLSILLQYQDPNGDLGISEKGWEEVSKYLNNGYKPNEGESSNELLSSGKKPLAFTYISGVPAIEKEFHFNLKPINPDYGVIVMREQVGIVNKGDDKNYETAEKFVEWFGSAEVQSKWAKEFGSLPVNEKAMDGVQERIKELAESTKPMKIDWNFVRQHLNEWIEKIELEIYPF